MKTSEKGINLIKQLEGFSSRWYKDADSYSIGYGHFKLPSDNFDNINKSFADELLHKDVIDAENKVNNAIKIDLNPDQFDALVVWAYNTGKGSSDLFNMINRGDNIESIVKWWKSHYITSLGKTIPALIVRRKLEADLFAGSQITTKSTIPLIALALIMGYFIYK